MKCPKCGADNLENADFCSLCNLSFSVKKDYPLSNQSHENKQISYVTKHDKTIGFPNDYNKRALITLTVGFISYFIVNEYLISLLPYFLTIFTFLRNQFSISLLIVNLIVVIFASCTVGILSSLIMQKEGPRYGITIPIFSIFLLTLWKLISYKIMFGPPSIVSGTPSFSANEPLLSYSIPSFFFSFFTSLFVNKIQQTIFKLPLKAQTPPTLIDKMLAFFASIGIVFPFTTSLMTSPKTDNIGIFFYLLIILIFLSLVAGLLSGIVSVWLAKEDKLYWGFIPTFTAVVITGIILSFYENNISGLIIILIFCGIPSTFTSLVGAKLFLIIKKRKTGYSL